MRERYSAVQKREGVRRRRQGPRTAYSNRLKEAGGRYAQKVMSKQHGM